MSIASVGFLEWRVDRLNHKLASKKVELQAEQAEKEQGLALMEKHEKSATVIELAAAEFDEDIAEIEARIEKIEKKITILRSDLTAKQAHP